MYWIWLIIFVALTLILLVTVPQDVLRTAMGNCARADGSKSPRRRNLEIKHAWSLVGGMVVIPIILLVIHVNVTFIVENLYVDYVPQEWVAKIERADTIDNDVNEVLAEFAEWNEKQQQLHSHGESGSWADAIWSNWMYFAADAVLMGIAVYFFLGRYYLLLVSNYTKGVERRHRIYSRIDQKRSSEDLDDPLKSQEADTRSDYETLISSADREEAQEAISPYMNLNGYLKELSREGFLDDVFNGLVLPEKRPTLTVNRAGGDVVTRQQRTVVDQSLKNNNDSSGSWRESASEGLRKVENELKALRTSDPKNKNSSEILALEKQILELNQKISSVVPGEGGESSTPGGDKAPGPATKVALFCLMDTSSSMDEVKLDIAKRFFILLFLFLRRIHEHVQVIYIHHQATAEELDEDGFFKPRQQSGTVISSSLELMHEIILKRFAGFEYNIYAAQVSDGANQESDYTRCVDLLENQILHLLQYYIYVETVPGKNRTLWQEYKTLKADHKNLGMQRIDDVDTLYPRFRSLFDKRLS